MKRSFLIGFLLLAGCVRVERDDDNAVRFDDLTQRVQRLEQGKADAAAIVDAFKQRDAVIAELKASQQRAVK